MWSVLRSSFLRIIEVSSNFSMIPLSTQSRVTSMLVDLISLAFEPLMIPLFTYAHLILFYF